MKLIVCSIISLGCLTLFGCDPSIKKNVLNENHDIENKKDNSYLVQQGEKYYKGINVKQDYNKAFDYFLKAARNSDPIAQNMVASYYMNGLGKIKQDHKITFEWYKKSAELGSLTAIYNLGIAYFNGIGVEKDKDKAKNKKQTTHLE